MRRSTFLIIIGLILFIATVVMIFKDITGFPALTGILCFLPLAEGLTENNYESLDFYERKYIWKPKNKK